MKFKDWLSKWNLKLKIKTTVLDLELTFSDGDKNAAWELYVELITRSLTQKLNESHGDEQSALESIYEIFHITRTMLKSHGRKCKNFAKIAIPVLNQIVRPFTAKWHKEAQLGAFNDNEKKKEFRLDLIEIQDQIDSYINLLADMADVEELLEFERNE